MRRKTSAADQRVQAHASGSRMIDGRCALLEVDGRSKDTTTEQPSWVEAWNKSTPDKAAAADSGFWIPVCGVGWGTGTMGFEQGRAPK